MTSLSQSEYEALAAFRYALRQFLHFSEEAAKSMRLTPQQHQALLAVKGFPGSSITISELAERLKIRHHSAVGLVNRLCSQKLIVRESSEEDRRKVQLVLSSKGSKVLEALSAIHKRELKQLGSQLRRSLDLLK